MKLNNDYYCFCIQCCDLPLLGLGWIDIQFILIDCVCFGRSFKCCNLVLSAIVLAVMQEYPSVGYFLVAIWFVSLFWLVVSCIPPASGFLAFGWAPFCACFYWAVFIWRCWEVLLVLSGVPCSAIFLYYI